MSLGFPPQPSLHTPCPFSGQLHPLPDFQIYLQADASQSCLTLSSLHPRVPVSGHFTPDPSPETCPSTRAHDFSQWKQPVSKLCAWYVGTINIFNHLPLFHTNYCWPAPRPRLGYHCMSLVTELPPTHGSFQSSSTPSPDRPVKGKQDHVTP